MSAQKVATQKREPHPSLRSPAAGAPRLSRGRLITCSFTLLHPTTPHSNLWIPPRLTSPSIIADPKNAALYTNRALARLKLQLYDSVIDDCQRCLELKPGNMKAYYYLSQAQLALRDYDAALQNALRAHEICAVTADKSLGAVTSQVLSCKKARWEDRERRRIREGIELENETLALLEREKAAMLAGVESELERRDIETEWDQKIAAMKRTFEAARAADSKRREVPDWAIDEIGFGIMVDPVIVRLPRVDLGRACGMPPRTDP